ncbi:hypothetical protein [Actinomadura sp. K4S16]|uniref:hypothetical protein n=1 Tax=Actinomadura sp. K4S16 TaxID=1316147 RepID=UPI0011EE780E|nr:hypothetical protein [Actinomadura sp. K4S16]
MSNGARHGLGVLIGLVVTPVIALCLCYSVTKFNRGIQFFLQRNDDRWVGAGLVIVAAVLVGAVAGSRLSPLASLVPGSVYTAVGFVWVASPRWAFEHSGRESLREGALSGFGSISERIQLGYTMLGAYGFLLLLGVALLVASLAPSRWKSRKAAAAAPPFGGPPPAPMGPPPMHGGPAPMGAPQQPPAPGQSPSWQSPPQYGQPPAQPPGSNPPPLPPARSGEDRPSEPPAKSGSEDDEPPGEWTQMYGGNRPS